MKNGFPTTATVQHQMVGTKKLSADRMQYLMHMVGVFDEGKNELVGSNVVSRLQCAEDFRSTLRLMRESVGEKSHHHAMTSAKRSLQMLMLMTLVSCGDALSPLSPITIASNFNSTFVLSFVLLITVISVLCFMIPPRDEEPEPETGPHEDPDGEPDVVVCYDKIKVYNFICRCVAQADDLIATLDSSAEIASVSTLRSDFLGLYNEFEENGVTKVIKFFFYMKGCRFTMVSLMRSSINAISPLSILNLSLRVFLKMFQTVLMFQQWRLPLSLCLQSTCACG